MKKNFYGCLKGSRYRKNTQESIFLHEQAIRSKFQSY